MSEEFKLTLDTAVEEAPAPTLTLTPEQPEVAAKQEEEKREANAVKLDESMLSEAERKMVEEFSQKIDVTDSNQLMVRR